MRLPLSALFLLLGPALLADQVVLKNGDTITGSIVKKDGGKLTIHSEFLGDLTMPWTAVRSIRSDGPLTVELPGNQKILGRISTEGDQLRVAADAASGSAPLGQVVAVRNAAEQSTWDRLQHPGIRDLWTGFFDVGLALARGNARTDTMTTNLNATRATRHDKLTLAFSQIYGTARVNNVTSSIASAVRGSWTYDRDITPRFFMTFYNGYDHDRFQNLDLRLIAGLGFGVNAIKNPRTTLSFTGASNYARENFTDGLQRNSAEGSFGDDFSRKVNSVTSITQSFRFFPNFSNPGEYRATLDIGAVTALKKWLGWQVSASDRFLSNPVFGRQRNDLLLSTGLRITFSTAK